MDETTKCLVCGNDPCTCPPKPETETPEAPASEVSIEETTAPEVSTEETPAQ